jgi:RpiR family carbohydrate utilization transcriptional regulator
MLTKITEHLSTLGPAERRLADFIVQDPQGLVRMSLATLSSQAGVSEPTVIRFVRRLGCMGFSDFRMRLAQDLASGPAFVHSKVDFSDSLESVVRKIFGSSVSNLQSVDASLDIGVLQRAIDILAAAHRIELFATGQTSVVAMDAQQKFMFLGVPAVYQHDTQLQIMSAAGLRATDVAVCFSYTGQKVDIVRCAEAAMKAGATVIAVTRSDSALADVAPLTIPVDVVENAYLYSPTATRLAQFVILDVLATGVALRRGVGISNRIQAMKEAVEDRVALRSLE